MKKYERFFLIVNEIKYDFIQSDHGIKHIWFNQLYFFLNEIKLACTHCHIGLENSNKMIVKCVSNIVP